MHAALPLQAGFRVVTPHDNLFHFVFQHARHAGAWLRCVLPRAVASVIDWSSLGPAPDRLRGQALRLSVADLVFLAERTGSLAPVWIVVEHKAYCDTAVEEQLLRYVVHLRDRAPDHGAARPVPVVAVLLHHGDAAFAIDAPDASDPIAALRPRLPFVVDDLTASGEESLRTRPMTPLGTLALLCLRYLRGMSGDEALAAFARWADILRAADRDDGQPPGRDAISALGWYALYTVEIAPRDLHEAFERLLQRPEETIMSTAEKLKSQGRAEGKAEGLAEGLARGRAETLLRLICKRFGAPPAEVLARVRSATTADLDHWTDRILDAKTLADVFAS